MAGKDQHHRKKLTAAERHDVALDALRRARWAVDELTNVELHERIEKLGPWITDEFPFYDDHVVSTGTGIRITKRGRLYVRMMDGL